MTPAEQALRDAYFAVTERPSVAALCNNGGTTKNGPGGAANALIPALTPTHTGS